MTVTSNEFAHAARSGSDVHGPADVLVASAFGRGNWLAQEAARRGLRVCLVDASAAIARAAGGPDAFDEDYVDAEGPFGFFDDGSASDSQKQRLFDDGPDARIADRGACVWPPEGPIDGRSEATGYQIAARGLAPEVEAYLRPPPSESDALAGAPKPPGRSRLARLPFANAWLAALAHQAAATACGDPASALRCAQGPPSPWLAPLWTRRPTRAGAQLALAACEAAGVRVFADRSIADIRLNGRAAEAIEVRPIGGGVNAASSIEFARSFVWCLTGAETAIASPRSAEALFPDGPPKADWRWMRAKFSLEGGAVAAALPDWCAVLGDPFLPWTHDNLAIVRKADAFGKRLDVWLRLPSARAARTPDYAREQFERMRAAFADRLPGAKVALEALPREAQAGPERPPAQPVFSLESFGKAARLKSPNLFFDGPEIWNTLDWNGSFARQNEILTELLRLADQRARAAAKLAAKEQAAAARSERRPGGGDGGIEGNP